MSATPSTPVTPATPVTSSDPVTPSPRSGTLRLGTRRSALATAQSSTVAQQLSALLERPVDLVGVSTEGDRSSAPLAQIGGTGVFVTAVRDAVLAGEVDLAVHSLKDLPTAEPSGLALAAVPEREDARDVLCARDGLDLAGLPAGARVGTGSPRRAALVRLVRPDLEVVPVRGNVDTRLGLVTSGTVDAVVLAAAGLARLGRLDVATDVLDPTVVVPAPGQGALAVECREDDDDLRAVLAALDHASTRASVEAERALLATLEAGCSAPVGAYAVPHDDPTVPELTLTAVVAATDGPTHLRTTVTGPFDRAAQLGRDTAASLLDDGAGALVGPDRPTP